MKFITAQDLTEFPYDSVAGMIRLLGDSSVQVYSDGWKYICGDRWSSKDAEIVCTQLGSLNGVVDFYTLTPPSNVEYYGSRFDCYGTEKKLIECIHDKGNTCDTNNVAAATCTDCKLNISDYSLTIRFHSFVSIYSNMPIRRKSY